MRRFEDPLAVARWKDSGGRPPKVQEQVGGRPPTLTIDSFLGPSKAKRKFRPGVSAKAQLKYADAVNAAVRDKLVDNQQWWANKGPDFVVALYLKLHEHVYGVDDAEARAEWKVAATAAKRFAVEHFAGDYHAVVIFMRWCFGKEMKRAKATDFRFTWRMVFAPKRALVDYRVFLARVNGTE